jgi:hypothetical protein
MEFPNVCVLVDATSDDAFTMFNFRALRHALENICSVVLITNRCSKAHGSDHINIANERIFTAVEHHKPGRSVIPGNPDLKLLAALEDPRFDKYDAFVRIEFDVVCAGDIRKTYQQLCCVALSTDFAASQIRSRKANADWAYWNTLGNALNPDRSLPEPNKAAFLPIMCLSARFIEHYRAALREGWVGHYEALMPTVAEWHNLSVVDLGHYEPRFTAPDTFRIVRPHVYAIDISLLLHPIKRLNDLVRAPISVAHEMLQYAAASENPEFRCLADLNLSNPGADLLKSHFFKSDSVLSFGCDATSAFALACGAQLVTAIDSRMEQFRFARDRYNLTRYLEVGRLRLRHAEIGVVTAQGAPVRDTDRALWKRYTDVAWADIRPDLVLLAGPFRVLAALKAHAALGEHGNLIVACRDFNSRTCSVCVKAPMTLRFWCQYQI